MPVALGHGRMVPSGPEPCQVGGVAGGSEPYLRLDPWLSRPRLPETRARPRTNLLASSGDAGRLEAALIRAVVSAAAAAATELSDDFCRMGGSDGSGARGKRAPLDACAGT